MFGKSRNMRHIREELILVSSSSWKKKRKLEHIFLAVALKKLKSMAAHTVVQVSLLKYKKSLILMSTKP